MNDLGLLRSFLAVYRAGAITRAAQALSMSQPAVTAHVQSLERQLGAALFVRIPRRGVVPTAAADALAFRVAPHLDALADRNLIEPMVTGPPVRIGGPKDVLATLVIPAIAPLIADGLRVHARSYDEPDLMAGVFDAVATGALDMAVTVGAVTHRGVRVSTLFDKHVVLVGAPRWAGRISSDAIEECGAAALASVPVLAYSTQLPVISIYFRALFGTVPVIEPALIVDDLRSLTTAVRRGAGVTVLPWYYVVDDLRVGSMVELHSPHRRPTEPVVVAVHPAATDPRLQSITDALRCSPPARLGLQRTNASSTLSATESAEAVAPV